MLTKNTEIKAIHNGAPALISESPLWMLTKNTEIKAIHNLPT